MNRLKDPRVLHILGMVFLILFNLVNFIARRFVAPLPGSFADGLIDGAAGACMGIALTTDRKSVV